MTGMIAGAKILRGEIGVIKTADTPEMVELRNLVAKARETES